MDGKDKKLFEKWDFEGPKLQPDFAVKRAKGGKSSVVGGEEGGGGGVSKKKKISAVASKE